MSQKKCGFFGGSFDPIHLGHLHLAIELAEKHQLDEVFFCPTSQSPHKKESPPVASKEARRAMVTAAISPLPQFTLLDLEIQQSSYAYTIDTLRSMLKMDEQSKVKRDYFLLLGTDSLEQLHTWKEIDELLKLAPPLIGSRGHDHFIAPKEASKGVVKSIKNGLTPIPVIEISSTQIRERLQNGLYCGHLLPSKVWEYIQQHQFYRDKKSA